MDRIIKLRWELDSGIPQELLHNFSHTEGQFLVGYDQILNQYMNRVGLDLTKVRRREQHVIPLPFVQSIDNVCTYVLLFL